MSKMRVSLSLRGDEIKGTVELPGDPGFVLEGLALVVEQFSKQTKVSKAAIVQDLYLIVLEKVKP